MRSDPSLAWVTLNSPIVDSGVPARWSTIPASISQYGRNPYSSWPGAGGGPADTLGSGATAASDAVGLGVTTGAASHAARAAASSRIAGAHPRGRRVTV